MTYVAVDIETEGLSFKKHKILGVGVKDTYYDNGLYCTDEPATAHNGKFEAKFMRAANLDFNWQFDTLLAASVLLKRPKDLDLASVAEYYLNMPSWKSDTDKLFKKKNWVQLLKSDPALQKALADRNIYDLKATEQLTEVLLRRLKEEGMESFFFDKLMPTARLLVDMEYRGMRIDVPKVEEALTRITTQIGQLKTQLDAWSAPEILNWNSPIQLKKFLTGRGYNLWAYDFKKKTTVESTSSDVLENLLPNDNIRLILDYRGANKLHGFLSGWLEDKVDDRLYPSYNIANTRTGRLSCIEENQLVQVPGGSVPIKDIKVGDLVYCYDKTKQLTIRKVLRAIDNGLQECVKVKWQSSGTGKIGELICTPDHQLLTRDGGWKSAGKLSRFTKLVHLKRSLQVTGRQRLYGPHGYMELEEQCIKREFFKCPSNFHVHHIDEDKSNNTLSNLKILTPAEHTSLHAKERVLLGITKWDHLATAKRRPVYGIDNPLYIVQSKFQVLKAIAQAKGRLTYVNMDFNTFKEKCAVAKVNTKAICYRYGKTGIYLNAASIGRALGAERTTEQAAKSLGIGTRKLKRLCQEFGLEYNHMVQRIEKMGIRHVYDLEVEEHHNFIASEICAHNCSSPNLQQVPRDKEIRSLFIPSPGKIYVIGDYSQIEVRVAAHYTEDETLTKVFEDGLDFYGSIAINVLGVKCHANDVKRLYPKERKVAKEIGLSILYGIGAAKLSSIIKKKAGVLISKEECAQIIKDYFKSYPKLKEFRDHIIGKIERGEVLRTKYGRQFIIDPEKSFSTGVNTIVQSTASDACLFSQLEVEKRLKEEGIEAPLVGIIHDEIVRECDPKDAQKVGEIMEEIMCNQGFKCPLKFEWTIADSWGGKVT